MGGMKLQKHQRLTLNLIRDALDPYGYDVEVLGGSKHCKLAVVDRGSGRRVGSLMLASSPKNRDHMVKNARQHALGLIGIRPIKRRG